MTEVIQNILFNYPILAPVIFVLLRVIPIVFAPIPGLFMDFIGVAVFGWFQGFILAEIAVIIGTTIAFYIGRIFREPAVKRFASLEKVNALQNKYSENKQFWFLVFMRVVTSPVFDVLSYAAGLTKISYGKYIAVTFVASAPLALAFYYVGGSSLSYGIWFSLGFFVIVFVGMYLVQYLFKKDN